MKYTLSARVLVPLFLVAIAALVAVVAVGCHLFEGPATKMTEAHYFWCGDERCVFGREECSSGVPLRCIPAWSSAARDAGADQ